MRLWGQGAAALLAAVVAGVLAGTVLQTVVPVAQASRPSGPVLETVTPAQLAAMGLHLDSTVQPLDVPGWMTWVGIRPPTTILLRSDAEDIVRENSGDVHGVGEVVLTYATMARGQRLRGPALFHRLAWAVVGTRLAAVSSGGLAQVLWLIDAHSGRQLLEMNVPAGAVGALGAGTRGTTAAGRAVP